MTLQEMRSLDIDMLEERIVRQKKELNKLKLQHRVKHFEDASGLRKLKKEIAQLFTVLNYLH